MKERFLIIGYKRDFETFQNAYPDVLGEHLWNRKQLDILISQLKANGLDMSCYTALVYLGELHKLDQNLVNDVIIRELDDRLGGDRVFNIVYA